MGCTMIEKRIANQFSAVAILLTAVLLLMLPFGVLTAATKSLYVVSASGDRGETVTVRINVNDGSGVEDFGFDLNFDSGALTYVSTSKGNLVPGSMTFLYNKIGSNTVRIGGYGVPGLNSGGGTVAYVTFKINSSAAYGKSNLSLSGASMTGHSVSTSGGYVDVIQGVKINFFKAEPSTVGQGEETTLSWSIENANSANIDNGVGNVNAGSGSETVSPEVTTTYKLTAIGPNTKTATVTVTVVKGSKPVIESYSANPTTIVRGSASTLSWKVDGAKTVTIDNGVGSVNKNGGITNVKPKDTTTYTLSATNAAGTATATATVQVIGKPEINWFTSSNEASDPINADETAWLMWSVTGAETVTVDKGVGSVNSGGGSKKVSPNTTTRYMLTAVNDAGVSTAEATVAVTNQPRVRLFDAEPASVLTGQAVNFHWNVAGATTLTITPDVGPLTGRSGVVGHIPPGTRPYTITATNAAGSDSRTITVTVVKDAPDLEISVTKVDASSVSAPSTGRRIGKGVVGTTSEIDVLVENIGAGDAGAFKVRLEEDGITLDEVLIGGLLKGASRTINFSYMPMVEGDNYIDIIADPEGVIPEIDTSNNEIEGRFVGAVVNGTDLVISHVRITKPSSDGPPNRLRVSFRITNCGDKDADGFNYRAYITTKANKIRSKDTLIVEGQITGLEADGDYVEVHKTVLVKKLNTKFYFRGFVDINNAVAEVNEENNELTRMFLRASLIEE